MGTKSNCEWTDLRPYNDSHVWLAFAFHINSMPPDLLAQLGGVASRCRVLQGVYLPPAISNELLNVYLAKGVHGTTAIEGNALTEEEVRQRIEGRMEVPKSMEYQQQEVDNVIEACELIRHNIVEGNWNEEITPERICQFNELVLKKLPLDERVKPGQVRKYPVSVYDYVAPPDKYCDELLQRMCDWLNNHHLLDRDSHQIVNAIVRAIIFHIYIAWIHPFGDGNGRTARLLEYHILMAARVPSIAAHLLSNHYNKTRPEYLQHLAQASKSGGDMVPFIKYAVQGLQDGLNEQYKVIEEYQRRITWRDFVYQKFKDESGPTARRRRQLALDLSIDPTSAITSKKSIPTLTTDLAALYANKGAKTLSRDLNYLEDEELIIQSRTHVMTAIWTLNAFKPQTRPSLT